LGLEPGFAYQRLIALASTRRRVPWEMEKGILVSNAQRETHTNTLGDRDLAIIQGTVLERAS
jgi:hypothetical protein